MLNSLLPDDVRVDITIVDKSFIYQIRDTQSNFGPLGDTDGYIQLIPAKYKSDKPKTITGVEKSRLKMVVLTAVS